MADYLTRLVDRRLDQLLPYAPAVFLTGPRAVGKTTTAERRVAETVRLDIPREAAVWRADPDALLRSVSTPVLLDEWQLAPEVMGAVKRAVDSGAGPGSFVVTGSAGSDLAPATWPGTGRLLRVPIRGLTRRERERGTDRRPLVDRLLDVDELAAARSTWTVVDYVTDALRGGFPAVVDTPEALRRPWFQTYVDQLVSRDVPALGGGGDAVRARRHLAAWVAASGTVTTDQTLHETAGVGREAGQALSRRLADVGIIDTVPAWWSSQIKRLTKAGKRFVADCGVWAELTGVTVDGVLRDAELLGRLLETYVHCQVRPEVDVADRPLSLYHLRMEEGRHEVDVVLDLGGDGVLGLEVKAASAPDRRAGRHLEWLRDRLGDRYRGGVVLCSTSASFPLAEGVWAAPLSFLWDTDARRQDTGLTPPGQRASSDRT